MRAAALTRTALAFREAGREARSAWTRSAWLAVAAVVVAALLPLVLPASVGLDRLAHTAYLALAAVGLGFAVGIGAMPSLAQGAFVGVGAVVAAHLVDAGASSLLAAAVAALVAGAAGAVVAAGLVRFRPVYVVVGTWLLTWLFAAALAAYPSLSGGARGLIVPPVQIAGLSPTPTVHYELALGLVGLAVLGHRTLARSSFGLSLRAAGQRPAAATALGVASGRLRLAAFAGAALVGGLAGGLSVQLDAVMDPGAYGPSLSFTLLVAVLVGGAASSLGPVAGVLALGCLSLLADAAGRLTGADTARFGPMLTAGLLLAVLSIGSEGIVPALAPWLPGRLRRQPSAVVPTRTDGATLTARGLGKRFGGLVALDGLDLDLRPARIGALIGPNGSGKTTALRVVSGVLEPDTGSVSLDGRALAAASSGARVRDGLVRTLQANGVFPELTALENAVVGAALRDRYAGPLRTLVATPKARAEARVTHDRALAALAAVGLQLRADDLAANLSGSEQRLLMIASALATGPSVLLLDEPSAGAGRAEVERLADILGALRGRGLTILVVEHNLRLVRSVADEVVVLHAGSPLAAGAPDAVAGDPAVRAAYLGRQSL